LSMIVDSRMDGALGFKQNNPMANAMGSGKSVSLGWRSLSASLQVKRLVEPDKDREANSNKQGIGKVGWDKSPIYEHMAYYNTENMDGQPSFFRVRY